MQLYDLHGHSNDIENYFLSSDGKHIVTSGKDHKVNIWNNKGLLQQTIPRQKGHLDSIATTPDTTKLISAGGSEGTTIEIWDTTTAQCIQNLDSKNSRIMSIAANNDATTIAAGHMNGSLWLWKDGAEARIEAHNGYIGAVAVSKDGSLVISSGSDKLLHFWNAENHELLYAVALQDKVESMQIHDSYVSCKIQGVNQHWDFSGQPCSEKKKESEYCINNSGEYTVVQKGAHKAAFPVRLQEPAIMDNRLYGNHNNHLFILQIED